MRFAAERGRLVLRGPILAGVILLSGLAWFVEGLVVGDDRWIELGIALFLAFNLWRRTDSGSPPEVTT